jgi:hypothetical protein
VDILGFDINVVIGIALATLVMHGMRRLMRTRFWGRVFSEAKHNLESPRVPIDDPEKAAEKALVDAHRPELRKIARALRESMHPFPFPERVPVKAVDEDDTPRIGTRADVVKTDER